jgi:methylmalonyl-CoA/ethylmalonyl-CoA epimerase
MAERPLINVKTLQGYITGLQHVGHIVDDLDAAAESFRKLYGLEDSAVRRIPEQADGSEPVRFAFVAVGDTEFELIEPRSDEARAQLGASPCGGAGINHVAWRVTDIDACVKLLAERGIRPGHVTPAGVVSTGRSRIVYLDPADTGGLLVELVEMADAGQPA